MSEILSAPFGHLTTCFSCGTLLGGMLERLGSLRCDACRDAGAPLDPRLVVEHLEHPSVARPSHGD